MKKCLYPILAVEMGLPPSFLGCLLPQFRFAEQPRRAKYNNNCCCPRGVFPSTNAGSLSLIGPGGCRETALGGDANGEGDRCSESQASHLGWKGEGAGGVQGQWPPDTKVIKIIEWPSDSKVFQVSEWPPDTKVIKISEWYPAIKVIKVSESHPDIKVFKVGKWPPDTKFIKLDEGPPDTKVAEGPPPDTKVIKVGDGPTDRKK